MIHSSNRVKNMDDVFDRQKYISVLESTLNTICFDRASGKRFSFEKLYYPLVLDDGKNAFQSYKEQIEQAKKGNNEKDRLRGIRAGIRSLSSEVKKKAEEKLGEKKADEQKAETIALLDSVKQKTSKILNNSGNHKPIEISDEENNNIQSDVGLQVSSEQFIDEDDKTDKSITYYDAEKYDFKLEEDEYGLYPEEDYEDKHNLSVRTKRVLAIANAGHGKTTLLRRIALFYCYSTLPELREKKEELVTSIEEHNRIKKIYGLDEKMDYIPCYIPLRKYDGKAGSFKQIICECIGELFNGCESGFSYECINTFLDREHKSLLLLIDGLDELSNALAKSVLTLLEEYLEINPLTTVMMTSRVAGITNPEIMDSLKKMKFIGRSILPLTDDDAKAYSTKWIEETQEGDAVKTNLKKRLSQVLSREKYDYLKEFMRTPLELLVILKQLANDSLALDRYQLFHDMLFELFTSHERVDRKGILFEDTMSVLGCIAYQMQLRGSLYVSEGDLELIIENLNALNYHSGIISTGDLTDYIRFLNSIAMNIGIVEKERRDGEEVFTFPIRSYQEYLTAHACCHLVVDMDSIRPEPFCILSNKIDVDEWTKIIIFSLSDLYTTNQSEFDRLLEYVFSNEKNDTRLCTYIESDLEVTKEQAKIICERFFESNVLTDKQKKIIMAWSGTKSAYAYNFALKNLFMKSEDRLYSCACAFSTVIDSFMNNNGDFRSFLENVKDNNPKKCLLAAAIISECISLFYGENIEGYEELAQNQLVLFDGIVDDLYKNARQYKDFASIKALADICIVRNYKESTYRKLLDEELRTTVFEYLTRKEKESQFLCIGKYEEKPDEYYELLDIFTVLGSFPVVKKKGKILISSYAQDVLNAMYELSKDDNAIDQIAIVLAMWCCIWDYERFIEAWTHDICREKDLDENYRYVIKTYCSEREQAHFEVLKKNKAILETAIMYMQIKNRNLNASPYLDSLSNAYNIFGFSHDVYGDLKKNYINEICSFGEAASSDDISGEDSVLSLFRRRDISGAARFCAENIGKEPNANFVNLSFLLRFGKIGKEAQLPYSYEDIPRLLKDAVGKGEKYALMNLALYYFENQRTEEALNLLMKLKVDDWKELSYGFWKQELWDTNGDPEGALVCVLAHEYGGCDFVGFEEMLNAAKERFSDVIKVLDTRMI